MKNKSEMLLEGYLRGQGYRDFDFEPQMPGTSKRPDYRLRSGGHEVLLEVKEFRAEASDFTTGFGSFDPYPPLREKINAARDKFKALKQHCCCLVLHNVDKPLVLLDWQHLYGAMLGNLAFSVPIALTGRAVPQPADVATIFTSGGKMHQERKGVPIAPQNQTISAIIVLSRVSAGERLFQKALKDREEQTGRGSNIDDIFREAELASGTLRDLRRRPLRLVVHENPYARVRLPPELFNGPWDERYGAVDGRIQQVFKGDALTNLPPKYS